MGKGSRRDEFTTLRFLLLPAGQDFGGHAVELFYDMTPWGGHFRFLSVRHSLARRDDGGLLGYDTVADGRGSGRD